MPVKKDALGRRYVEVEGEVPGTPEEVWNAIATGPGVSSWFVPTDVEFGEGGVPVKMVSHFGPGSSMDSPATITLWDPPRRFVADSPGSGPNSPLVATEWTVEAKGGGICIVRVVHSWVAEGSDWDGEFEQAEHGWPSFFRMLRLYVSEFHSAPSAMFQFMTFTSLTSAEAWRRLVDGLGVATAAQGDRVTAPAGAPTFAGRIEVTGPDADSELLIKLAAPMPGLASLFVMPMGKQVAVATRLFFYGADAQATIAREEPRWSAWLTARFPPAAADATT